MSARDAATAVGLNLLAPGAGHLYLGRARRFFAPLALFALVVIALGTLGLISTLAGFMLVATMALALALFAIVDGAILGVRFGRGASRWYTRWFVLVTWVLVSASLVLFWVSVRESVLGYATYRIPGTYMRPALVPGDIVLVNTHLPPDAELAPNTIVVFRHPDNGALHILRIKQQTSLGFYSLSSGLPFAPSFDGVPRANISGAVTGLLWSPERGYFGRPLK